MTRLSTPHHTSQHPRGDTLRDGHRDEGTVTAFTVILTTALLACTGLVLDGGLALTARVRAVGLAQEAARTGAQELDLAAYRTTGTLTLRPDTAVAAAQAYLTTAGATGTVIAGPTTVTVTVTLDQPTALLTLIGLRSLRLTGHATALATPRTPTGP